MYAGGQGGVIIEENSKNKGFLSVGLSGSAAAGINA